ncbi:MAG: T9SS type A sorting domain-containing protein, partial [Chitinophagaceae bacterium]
NESSLRGTKQSVENIWQTANEINVSYFNIQRSVNGKDFINIGTVKANNITYNEYSFTNPLTTNHLPFTIYYRIQSIDNDGRKKYSTTQQITIKPQTTNKAFVYPNPAKDIVNIECKDGIKQILITNYLGQVILRQAQNENSHKQLIVNCKQFIKGVYIIKVLTLKGDFLNEKLIIE